LGGVAGQVNSYLQSELLAATKEPFGDKVSYLGSSQEIRRWRKVLKYLVKPQLNGTVTSDVLLVTKLTEEAVEKGCLIEPQSMFNFLADEKRRILRPVAVTNVKSKAVIPCYSLGHDVLASALQVWYERDKLERKTLLIFRITYAIVLLAFLTTWHFFRSNILLGLTVLFLLVLVSTFVPFRASLLERDPEDRTKKSKSTNHDAATKDIKGS
jgi:hypothetical protein